MNISFLLPDLSRAPIGGHKIIYEYSNYLCEHGHNVHIYFFYGNRLKNRNIPEALRKIIIKIFGSIVGPREWFPLNKRIKMSVIADGNRIKECDIIIATGVETALPVSNIKGSNLKKFYFIQDFENWSVPDEFVYKTYGLGLKNIVISEWLKRIVDEHSKDPSTLITNGINTDIFRCYYRERVEHSIVFHYRKAEHKGCKYAIKVIKELRKIYNDLFVIVVSNEKKPEDFVECEYYWNIKSEKVAELNNKSKVFLCTTIDEGFGLPGLEAMACGCVLVSTDYKGVKEYAINYYNALLSPVRDVDSMVQNVISVFEKKDLCCKLTYNGIRTGKEHSFIEQCDKVERILTE